VCVSGYSRTMRYVTSAVREQVFPTYHIGYPPPAGAYELDHLIPLELGGDNSASNLWPEPYHGANNADVKDHLENHLHELVCSGQVELGTAQHVMAGDWRAAAARYGSTAAASSPSITTSTSPAPSRGEAPVSAGNGATARSTTGRTPTPRTIRGRVRATVASRSSTSSPTRPEFRSTCVPVPRRTICGSSLGAVSAASPRLTNGFSKKVENLAHAVSLHYNFARPHKTLTKARDGYPTTPAMATGAADHVWTLTEIAGLLD